MSVNNLHSNFNIVKGMTNVRYKREVIHFVDNLIANYAKYHKSSGCYLLSIDSVDELDRMEFASLVMILDDNRASEATGHDNPDYTKYMLPALTKHLESPLDKDLQADFIAAWQEGVTNYFLPLLEEIIEERLDSYNCDLGYVNKELIYNHAHNR